MSDKKSREQFEELLIPRKELPKVSNHYRVYKDRKDFIIVEAESALEALKKSELQQAYRIERDAIYLANVLNLEALSNRPAAAAQPAAETPAAAAATPEAQTPPAQPVADAAAADAPLSTAEVDKLLKSENPTNP